MPGDLKDHLKNTFEDLGADNFKKFKSKLCDRKQEPRVRRATIETLTDAIDLSDVMVQTFTSNVAVDVTIEILRAIGCNETAEELLENTGHVASPRTVTPPNVAPPVPGPSSDEHFIDKHWEELIQRVNGVNAILDALLQKKVITNEDYSTISTKETQQMKMRQLLMGPITSAGTKGKDVLYAALKKTNAYLVEDLESAQRK